MVRVYVLGELTVEAAGQAVELTGSWRARSLLAWLALNPGLHARSDLAPRFWPDVLDTSARASLRNGLWALRRALGEEGEAALLATRDRVGLAGPPAVWTDVAEFAEHLKAGRLDDALALCRGEVLAGLDEDWVLEFRDAHRLQVSELLERMAERAEASDPAAAVVLSRKRVALDPLAEDAQRALIARLARAGDRARALAAFAELRDRLRRDLGIAPSPETSALVAEIRDEAAGPSQDAPAAASGPSAPSDRAPAGGWAPGAPFPLPPRLRRPDEMALVGRGPELDALRRLWAVVRDGGGAHLALVTGEAGIGKTRLARELAREAARAGAIVLHGSASEDLLMPHQHFAEAFGYYVAVTDPSELERSAGARAADLAPILPGLAGRLGVPDALQHGAESRHFRLVEGVASLLEVLAADTPVLLVLDDLHWAERSTSALVGHVLESRPYLRLLVVATYRTGEGVEAMPTEALQRLARHRVVERLLVGGLDTAQVAGLAEAVSDRPLRDELVTAIREETGGNPFFVQEVVRHLRDSSPDTPVLSLARGDVPERVREAVNLRLARLDDGCVRLLTVAAVAGPDVRVSTLERVSDLDGEDLAAALDEAVSADLLLETERDGHETVAFAHALVRRTLLRRLSRGHRRRIHARMAEVIRDERGDEALPEIAYHLCEARPVVDRDEALAYAIRAAERATADLAYAEAVDLFTRACALLPPEDPVRRRLVLKRAVAYQALFHMVYDAAKAHPHPG